MGRWLRVSLSNCCRIAQNPGYMCKPRITQESHLATWAQLRRPVRCACLLNINRRHCQLIVACGLLPPSQKRLQKRVKGSEGRLPHLGCLAPPLRRSVQSIGPSSP